MMILKKIKLRNFLSHEDTELDFPLGITVIVGPNGAGKTAIMDAIVHALLGFENIKLRGERVDDLIRRGTSKLEIKLIFESDNKEYIVYWTRTKGGHVSAILRRSDIGYIARSARQVKQEILKLLGLDSKTLMNSIFIRQGEITNLIDIDPSKRKAIMSKMIGLDRLEKAWQNMMELIKFIDEYKRSFEKDLNRKQGELKVKEENLRKLNNDIIAQQNSINKIKIDLENTRKEYNAISREKQILDMKENKFKELQKKLELTSKYIENEESNVKRLRNELEQCKKAKEEIEKLKPEVAKIPLLESYSTKVKELMDYNKEKDQLEKSISILSKARNEIRTSLEKITDIAESIHKNIKKLELPDDPIDLYNRAIRLSSEIIRLVRQLNSKENELNNLSSNVSKLLPEPTRRAWKNELNRLEEDIKKLNNRIREKTEQLGGINGEIRKLNNYLRNLDKLEVCPLCRTRLTPEHKYKAKQEISKEIESLGKEQKRLERELEELKKQVEELKRRKDDILKISGNLDRIEKLSEEIVEDRKNLKELYYQSIKVLEEIKSMEALMQQKLQNVNKHITLIHGELKELIEKLGYTPNSPEEELAELRRRKERYDQLKLIADQYDQKVKDLEEAEEKLNNLKQEKEKLLENIKRLDYNNEQHRKIKEDYEKIKDKLIRLEQNLKNKEEELDKTKNELTKIKEDIEQLKNNMARLREKLEKINDLEFKLEKIREAFSKDGIQKMLRQRIAPYISELATKYIERFNLDITSIIVNEDLDISVIREGEAIPITLLSGGEKVAIAIALRLAIAKALAEKLSTIIMDEPTIHLDEERRRLLVEVVKGFFREGAIVPQMIIITHDRELEEVADTLYRVEKINGISKITELNTTLNTT